MSETGYYFNYSIFVAVMAWRDLKREKDMRAGLLIRGY
jgi:hypothetical protein